MPIDSIANGEGGASVRTKLNLVITEANKVATIEASVPTVATTAEAYAGTDSVKVLSSKVHRADGFNDRKRSGAPVSALRPSTSANVSRSGDTFTQTNGSGSDYQLEIAKGELGIAAGESFSVGVEIVSGTFVSATVQQFNDSTGLDSAVNLTLVGDFYILEGQTWHASATKVRIRLRNNSGSASVVHKPVQVQRSAYFKPPVPADGGITGRLIAHAEQQQNRNLFEVASFATAAGTAGSTIDGSTIDVVAGAWVRAFVDVGLPSEIVSGATVTVFCKITGDNPNGGYAIGENSVTGGGPAATRALVQMTGTSYWAATLTVGELLGSTPVQLVLSFDNRPSAAGSVTGTSTALVVEDITISLGSVAIPPYVPGAVKDYIADNVDPAIEAAADEAEETAIARAAEKAKRETLALLDSPAVTAAVERAVRAADEIAAYVANSGNDTTGTGTYAAPYATVAKALTVTSAGAKIGLRNGERHTTGSTYAFNSTNARVFIGVGPEEDRAILDFRQSLAAATWTSNGDGTWSTTATHRVSTSNVGGDHSSASEAVYRLWLGDDALTWQTGGVNIAANQALVAAAAGSFTVYKSGSTTPDPRNDTNGTAYVYTVKLADGSDPNGQAIFIADYNGFFLSEGAEHRNVSFVGSMNKDNANMGDGSLPDGMPIFRNVTLPDHPNHGMTGPAILKGHCYAYGRGATGSPRGDAKGRTNGYSWNIYTSFLINEDLEFDHLYGENSIAVLFGHGTGAAMGYNSLRVKSLIGANCGHLASFGVTGAAYTAWIVDGVTIDYIASAEGSTVESGVQVDGTWVVGSTEAQSHIEFDGSPYENATNRYLCRFTGTAPSLHLINTTWRFNAAKGVGISNALAMRDRDGTHTTPILTLDNCHDLSDPAKRGSLWRSGSWGAKTDLRLVNGSTIGDIVGVNTFDSNALPAALSAEPGCTLGFNGYTRQETIDYLAARGITATLPSGVIMIDAAGEVVDDS